MRAFNNGERDLTWVHFNNHPQGGFGCDVLESCGPVPLIPPPCPADVNEDLTVNVLDLIELLLAFGSTCPAAG